MMLYATSQMYVWPSKGQFPVVISKIVVIKLKSLSISLIYKNNAKRVNSILALKLFTLVMKKPHLIKLYFKIMGETCPLRILSWFGVLNYILENCSDHEAPCVVICIY